MYSVGILILLCMGSLIVGVIGQSNDPIVEIKASDPESTPDKKIEAHIAKDVTMNCQVENMREDLQVRWARRAPGIDGRPETIDISNDMSVTDNTKWSIEKPTLYTWRLRIKAIHQNDEGNYTCFVRLTGNNNRKADNRTIYVVARPLIIEGQSSVDTTIDEGESVMMRCNASGRPHPTIWWRREGNAILPGGGVRRVGEFFEITKAQYTARGNYMCEAINPVGKDIRNILFTIKFAPKVRADPERVGQALGYTRTLKCIIEADPPPSLVLEDNQLSWSKGSREIIPDERIIRKAIMGAYGRLTLELTIKSVQEDDYGRYVCKARTSRGVSEQHVDLYKTKDPQPDKTGPQGGANAVTFSLGILPFLVLSALFQFY